MDTNEPPERFAEPTPALKEWETPTLITEDIVEVTKGGSLTLASPGDDTWYRS